VEALSWGLVECHPLGSCGYLAFAWCGGRQSKREGGFFLPFFCISPTCTWTPRRPFFHATEAEAMGSYFMFQGTFKKSPSALFLSFFLGGYRIDKLQRKRLTNNHCISFRQHVCVCVRERDKREEGDIRQNPFFLFSLLFLSRPSATAFSTRDPAAQSRLPRYSLSPPGDWARWAAPVASPDHC